MKFRPEVLPFILAAIVLGVLVALFCWGIKMSPYRAYGTGLVLAVVLGGYFLYFFRDPERMAPDDPALIVAAADGMVAKIVDMEEKDYLKVETVRISIFLSLFDVHVNRAPLAGKSTFLGYFPGRRFFTFQEKSSEFNQHNAILLEGKTRCLVKQIVGPVCRRVVYWPDHDRPVDLEKGARIGMMKFGSRLDMYFPKSEVEVLARVGDRVRAGESVIARIT